MSDTVARLVAHLEENRAILRAAVDRVPTQDRERRPAEDRWSVAEVLEHLAIIETRVTVLIDNAVQGLSANPSTTDTNAPLLNPAHHALLLNRAQRVETREANAPTGKLEVATAWQALEKSRAGMMALLEKAESVDLSQFTQPHPIAGPINGYEWIAFVGGHEARHAAQIDEIAAELKSASADA